MQLSKMVAYQKGAVVNRTVVKKSTGNVMLFSFDKGQGYGSIRGPSNDYTDF